MTEKKLKKERTGWEQNENLKAEKYKCRLTAWTLNKQNHHFLKFADKALNISESLLPHPPKRKMMQAPTSSSNGHCHLSSFIFHSWAYLVIRYSFHLNFLLRTSVNGLSIFPHYFPWYMAKIEVHLCFPWYSEYLSSDNRIHFLCIWPTAHWTPGQQRTSHHLISLLIVSIPLPPLKKKKKKQWITQNMLSTNTEQERRHES